MLCVVGFFFVLLFVTLFVLYWKYCTKRGEKSIHRTLGAKIRLRVPVRLFNLVMTCFRKISGRYLLRFKPSCFLSEQHYERELEVMKQIAPTTLSSDEIKCVQRKGLKLLCDSMNQPNLWWTAIGRISLFWSHKREFKSR